MIPGIVAAQGGVATSAALWTPLNMATVPQIYLDAQDSVVTGVSGFASAISNLGAMGANGDFSQATADNRPAILAAELNGKRVLRFDGTDDRMQGASVAQKDLMRNVGAGWVFVIYKKRLTDASSESRVLFQATPGTNAGARFAAYAGFSSALNKPTMAARRLDAESAGAMSTATAEIGNYLMALSLINYSTRSGSIYINGAAPTTQANLTASAGNTSNTASQEPLSLGSFPAGTGAVDADLAAVVVSNAQPSADDIDKLFGWAAHKYGLAANLPAEHPYKSSAPTV